ncbi:MAG: AAA family ATPase [Chitinophagales bacterium]|nr:AAA family ATPase [Chitinophagales bacterium]
MENLFYIGLDKNILYQKEFIDNGYPLKYFGPTNNINILIGANNSRKSRLMRNLIVDLQEEVTPYYEFNIQKKLNSIHLKLNSLIKMMNLLNRDNSINLVINYIDRITHDENLKHILDNKVDIKTITNTNRATINLTVKKATDLKENIKLLSTREFITLVDKQGFSGTNSKEKIIKDINNFILESNLIVKSLKSTEKNSSLSMFEIDESREKVTLLQKINNSKYRVLEFSSNLERSTILLFLEPLITELENFESLIPNKLSVENITYIPILRTAYSLYNNKNGKVSNDVLKETVTELYFKNKDFNNNEHKTSSSFKIFSGYTLYEEIKTLRNSIKKDRDKLDKFQEFIGTHFFNTKEFDIISQHNKWDSKNEHILIKLPNEDDRTLHNLGDGIQSLIILLFPIFMANENDWFFIEEPELNLHPSLQRIFLETISSNKDIVYKNLKIFFTTHSNHLLDLSIEHPDNITIFSFENKSSSKESVSVIKEIKSKDLSILNQLGVNNSSVFMANCSIWVEGHTDRKYIKGFIELYKQVNNFNYNEDIHFSFFEYSGSNLMHYNFDDEENEIDLINANFLSNRILVVADEDTGKEKKHNYFKQELKEKYITTRRFNSEELEGGKEIENLLPPIIIEKMIKNIFKENKFLIPKKETKHEDYMMKSFGSFIKTKFQIKNKVVSDSSSLAGEYKGKFADTFLELVSNKEIKWNDLGIITQTFTKEIIKFIQENNTRN